MGESPYHDLSMRERQSMEVLHRLGEAAVSEVQALLPDRPDYDAVRMVLAALEKKGRIEHRREGRRYIYRPVERPDKVRLRALRHLLRTFFGGSASRLVSTLVDSRAIELSDAELNEMLREIEAEVRSRGKS